MGWLDRSSGAPRSPPFQWQVSDIEQGPLRFMQSGHGLMFERIVHDARGPSALRAWQYTAGDKARIAPEPLCRGAPKILGNDS
jgi:hypothetical protein